MEAVGCGKDGGAPLEDFNVGDNPYSPTPAEEDWTVAAFPLVLAGIVLLILGFVAVNRLTVWMDVAPTSFFGILASMLPFHALLLLVPAATAALSSGDAPFIRRLGFSNRKDDYWREVLLCEAVVMPTMLGLSTAVYLAMTWLGLDTSSPITQLLDSVGANGMAAIFVISVIVAPISEELAFRKVCFTFFKRFCGVVPAMALSSLLFASLHGGWVQLVPLFLFGMLLQTLFIRHNSLIPCVMLHCLHNSLVMIPVAVCKALGVELAQ